MSGKQKTKRTKETSKMNSESKDTGKPKRRGKHPMSRRQCKRLAAEKAAETAVAWLNAEAEASVAEACAILQGPMPAIWKRTFRSLGRWHRQQVMFFLGGNLGEEEEKDEEKSSQEGEYVVNEVNLPETVKEDDIKEDEIKEDDIKQDDTKKDDTKGDDIKEDDIKEDEIKEDDIKEDDTKEDDTKEADTKEDDIKEDENQVDADYLSFIEVTRKHQQELKKIRAEEEQKIMHMRARDLAALTISARPGN